MPVTHFSPANADVLVQLVRHVEQSHRVSLLIEQCAKSSNTFNAHTYIELLKVQNNESGAIRRLATSLRLTQQAVYRADRADNRPVPVGPSPWEPDPED